MDAISDGLASSLSQYSLDAVSLSGGATEAGKLFQRHGLLHVQGVLTQPVASALETYITKELEETKRAADHRWFGSVYGFEEQGKRWDLKLRLEAEVVGGLNELLERCQPLLKTIGDHSWKLTELAGMCTFPGDPGQPVHADTSHLDEHSIVTIFVALHDIDMERGPTRMFPDTHQDKELHLGLKVLDETSGVLCTMRRGDCVLMDSRLLHCGTGNSSSQHRYLFYTSWIAEHGKSRSSTNTIIPSYQNCLLLDSWRKWTVEPPAVSLEDPENMDAHAPGERRERLPIRAGSLETCAMEPRRKKIKLGLGRWFAPQTRQRDVLLSWLKGRGVDIAAMGVEIRASPRHGLGLFSTRRLHAGEAVVRLPMSLSLNAAKVSETAFGRQVLSVVPSILASELLWLYMMWGRDEADACPWHGYLQSIPSGDVLSCMSSDAASTWLAGTPVGESNRSELERQRNRHSQVVEKLIASDQSLFSSPRFNFKHWLWARSCYVSRAFHRGSFPQEDSDLEWASDVLCPILDILNHRPDAQVEWRFEVGSASMFLPLTAPGYEAGDEIFNLYSPALSNAESLSKYGFSIPKNPFDSVQYIRFCLPVGATEGRERLQSAGSLTSATMTNDGDAVVELASPLRRGMDETPVELLRAASILLLGRDYDEESASCSDKVTACRAVAKALQKMVGRTHRSKTARASAETVRPESVDSGSLSSRRPCSRKQALPSRYSTEYAPAVYASSYRRILVDAMNCARNEAEMAELAAKMEGDGGSDSSGDERPA